MTDYSCSFEEGLVSESIVIPTSSEPHQTHSDKSLLPVVAVGLQQRTRSTQLFGLPTDWILTCTNIVPCRDAFLPSRDSLPHKVASSTRSSTRTSGTPRLEGLRGVNYTPLKIKPWLEWHWDLLFILSLQVKVGGLKHCLFPQMMSSSSLQYSLYSLTDLLCPFLFWRQQFNSLEPPHTRSVTCPTSLSPILNSSTQHCLTDSQSPSDTFTHKQISPTV